jgi:hypothetical protein
MNGSESRKGKIENFIEQLEEIRWCKCQNSACCWQSDRKLVEFFDFVV